MWISIKKSLYVLEILKTDTQSSVKGNGLEQCCQWAMSIILKFLVDIFKKDKMKQVKFIWIICIWSTIFKILFLS